ncbi:hypothetical protein M9Y10_028171 [Tritrichomonas musculus]|uniref:Uncharacterized protein n=1 Tax=Tritrichomonas musculus TaxID=1915356 RepID=A0ABR2KIJ7_9EUKA
MEENVLNNANQLAQETQPDVSQPNQIDTSNQMNETSLPSNLSKENITATQDIAANPQSVNEAFPLQFDNNQHIKAHSSISSSYVNVDSNIMKTIQQPKGNRSRLRNSGSSNTSMFYQNQIINNNSNINIRSTRLNSNMANLNNLNIIPSISTNNTNSTPNSSVYPSSTNSNNTTNVNSLPPSSPSPSTISTNKKDKIKKDKKLKEKKIKDKKEKTKTKKFHKINKIKSKMNSDSDNDNDNDNDDREWSRPSRHNSSTGSERSVRRNTDQIHQQVSGNPLDIWVMSMPFFNPIPTESEINEICGDIEKEMIFHSSESKSTSLFPKSINSNGVIGENQESENNKKFKHWSTWMKDVVYNTANASLHNSSKGQKSIPIESDQILSRNSSNNNLTNLNNNTDASNRDVNFIRNMPTSHPGILFPPGPTPEMSDISTFWDNSAHEFPTTDLQMQNYSIMHSLLSAFVTAEPDKKHDDYMKQMMVEYKSPFSFDNKVGVPPNEINHQNLINTNNDNNRIYNNTDQNTKDINDSNDNKSEKIGPNNNDDELDISDSTDYNYLPTHVPAPQLEFNDYLSHSFEERLEFELQSAGIHRPSHQLQATNSLAQEIEKYREELSKIQPQINEIKEEIITNYPIYKEDESRRLSELRAFNDLLPKKGHKK